MHSFPIINTPHHHGISVITDVPTVIYHNYLKFPGSRLKPTCQYRKHKRPGFDPWVRKIPWRREWQLTPVFLPGESRGQRSLVGYSPESHKNWDTTERLTLEAFVKRVRVFPCLCECRGDTIWAFSAESLSWVSILIARCCRSVCVNVCVYACVYTYM